MNVAVAGADAVVFAAGAGPGSGAARKVTVDLGGAVKLMDAGVSRYVLVSSIRAGRPDAAPEQMRPYIEAKTEADRQGVRRDCRRDADRRRRRGSVSDPRFGARLRRDGRRFRHRAWTSACPVVGS